MSEQTREIVLASGSAIRRRLLEAAGIRHRVVLPDVDEPAFPERDPDARARGLAEKKALDVAAREPGALVLGSDQVFTLDGRCADKPETPDALRAQLRAVSGRTHRFHCGVALAQAGRVTWSTVSHASVTLYDLDDDEIEAYVATGEGLGCAGGYRLEEGGVRLIRAIEGSHFTVLGLPVLELVAELRRRGLDRSLFARPEEDAS